MDKRETYCVMCGEPCFGTYRGVPICMKAYEEGAIHELMKGDDPHSLVRLAEAKDESGIVLYVDEQYQCDKGAAADCVVATEDGESIKIGDVKRVKICLDDELLGKNVLRISGFKALTEDLRKMNSRIIDRIVGDTETGQETGAQNTVE